MRLGENPIKKLKLEAEPPAAVTVGVLNSIPELSGYHEGALDVLKLCVASIRAHASEPIDVLVVDNGSCESVRDALVALESDGAIDVLLLNSRNIGKANALQQILGSALGDVIVYADGDVYFH